MKTIVDKILEEKSKLGNDVNYENIQIGDAVRTKSTRGTITHIYVKNSEIFVIVRNIFNPELGEGRVFKISEVYSTID
jgi:hypothetical protein